MKRTFIPPQNRPSIRSAALRSESDSSHYLALVADARRRRQFIEQLIEGKQSIPGLEHELVKRVLTDLVGPREGGAKHV